MIARRTITLLIVSLLLAGCGNQHESDAEGTPVVNVYNWADYIAPDTVGKFEAEYGIKVNYDFYDADSTVTTKLLTGNSGFDVIIHSNWQASRVAPIGVFEKLDHARLPNSRHLDPELMTRIDIFPAVSEFMVPYHWGTTGYSWNVEMVRERLPDHPMNTSDVLFDPDVVSKLADCGVSLLDGSTDVFSAVLAYLGHDPRNVDASDENLAIAEAQLRKVRPYIRYFSNDKMISDLPNREVCVAQSWSGDFAQAQARANEAGIDIELRYTIAKEGSRLWADGFYIPKDAPNPDNAYLFINFMLRPEIAAANSNFTHYGNANQSSWEYMDREILDNPAIYPDESNWDLMYALPVADFERVRPRTRAFARVKSGLD